MEPWLSLSLIGLGFIPKGAERSSSREVRISWYHFFSVVYLSRLEPFQPKKGFEKGQDPELRSQGKAMGSSAFPEAQEATT